MIETLGGTGLGTPAVSLPTVTPLTVCREHPRVVGKPSIGGPRRRLIRLGIVALSVVLSVLPARAQTAGVPRDAVGTDLAGEPSAHPATLYFANRLIVTFHASVLARTPDERVAAAVQFLDRLVGESPAARVTTQAVGDAVIVGIGERGVFAILPADVNALAGETVERTAADAAARLQLAFAEAVEFHNPARLLREGLYTLGATVLFMGLLWLLRAAERMCAQQLNRTTERQLGKLSGGADLVRESHVPELLQRLVVLLSAVLVLTLTYAWATFVLRQFPYTRPWGESLRARFFATLLSLGQSVLAYLPNLLTVLVVVVGIRFLVRLSNAFFAALEQERITVPWLHPETAQPTRRIVAALLWLLAIVIAYPYLPGSGSDAFKGVSVFVGLMISLGSSGIMNQIMSGLTIIYSRALRVGDFVKIGDVEGTVENLGVLSTKIMTIRREEITMPNALVVSASTTNYSRHAEREGVQVSTSVTIGYDTPWRQVEALLILAAQRTAGVRPEPKPEVCQTGLFDFYVQYTLLVCLEQPRLRVPTVDRLHANILDAFNEYGVQITAPNYEADPGAAKIVPKDHWYAAPAAPPGETQWGKTPVAEGR